MNSENLSLESEYLAGSGFVLSAEQKAALQNSLITVKTHYKFSKVQLWGKICGLSNDYFIIQGCTKDELKNRSNLYSINCTDWFLLQPADEDMIELALKLRGRFTGRLSHVYEQTYVKRTQEENEFIDEATLLQMKEEDRLKAVIAIIDEESRIVPRGAYIKTPTGQVKINRSFEGLSVEESSKLTSYMHFRTLNDGRTQKKIEEDANLDPSMDFLDVISNDIPRGCWSLQHEKGDAVVVIRSLNWLGMTFFHIPKTNKFGSLYVGYGEKNVDLPFML